MSSHNHYMYPVIYEKDKDNNIGMHFPDFPSTAIIPKDITDGIKRAKDLLAFRILELEEKQLELPTPSEPANVELSEDERIIFIDIYMPPYRNDAANKAVTKNCTLPKWLRDAAEEAGLNFSHLLQTAIKEALHIKTHDK
ncbi:type II toxin-antitoxin system HicB family antitoxin [Metabacillus fastidiosus]|uniref:type II toxin-antitoxin system HicB family antitoxin n=1 Tax=Metabacillus fastidiosus TaxID=1458 RepID=UPI003D2682AD